VFWAGCWVVDKVNKKKTIVYLCNALDDATKSEREITTDSPAATKKVAGLCQAIKKTGTSTWMLSLGRGRQNRSGCFHRAKVSRLGRTAVVYSAFWHVPVMTHLISIISTAVIMRTLCLRKQVTVVAYNRSFHYLPALMVARFSGARCFLDLEDGDISLQPFLQRTARRLLRRVFDSLCSAGALVSTRSLSQQINQRRYIPCYGTVASEKVDITEKWRGGSKVSILYSGTLLRERGTTLLMDSIQYLERHFPGTTEKVEFIITGKGPAQKALEKFAAMRRSWVSYHGALTFDEYDQMLSSAHVGLCLNLSSSDLHRHAFPSKVIEYAAKGLLLVSTPVSDVPFIFSEQSALILSKESPEVVAKAIVWIVENRADAVDMARSGNEVVATMCNEGKVGEELVSFLGGAP